jgi:hypothetical protein
MLRLFSLLLAASVATVGPSVAGELTPVSGQSTPVTSVVELFTSQGCSSCPPADALLHRYAQRPDVVALSLPVDYWDYLGWKDTLASPQFSERQRAYARARGDGLVYTPQVVVNGLVHVNGSRIDEIDRAIASTAAKLAPEYVPLRISDQGSRVVIEAAGSTNMHQSATLWVAAVQRTADIDIQRGENRGHTLKYFNVVRDLAPVGTWSGQPLRIELDRAAVLRGGAQTMAVLLQRGQGGPIIGAALLE